MALHTSPVGTSMFVVSILGFFVSVIYIPQFSESWAAAFAIVFALMFIASMISTAHAVKFPFE